MSHPGIIKEDKEDRVVSHKLVVLGDVAVGKSSIAQRYIIIIYNNKKVL